jgi:enoyl-CoA hydratase
MHWTCKIERKVATLTLQREESGNNINLECLEELRLLSLDIAADSRVAVVLLRSSGKHFSIGMDVSVIAQMADQDFESYAAHLSAGQRCIDSFEAIGKPIIAEIQGFCIGAGVILAACADFRISSDRAIYSLPEVKRSIGVIMGLCRVTRLIGVAATKQMAMLGENFTAREMSAFGFLNEVVPQESLSATSDRWIRKILALPPQAVALNKQIVDFSYANLLQTSQRFELEQQFFLNQTDDFNEALRSFFEKRPPRYTGK